MGSKHYCKWLGTRAQPQTIWAHLAMQGNEGKKNQGMTPTKRRNRPQNPTTVWSSGNAPPTLEEEDDSDNNSTNGERKIN